MNRKEAIGVLLLVCFLREIQTDFFLKMNVQWAKQDSNGENLEGCDFHLEVEWNEVNFPVLKKAQQEEKWNWRQVNTVESAVFKGPENMHCSITVSVGVLYFLLIMCTYLAFIWACCFQLAIGHVLFSGFHGDTKMHCFISDWCNGVISSSDSVTHNLI